MHVLMINGSPHEKGCTYTALSEVAGQLENEGIETNIFHIGGEGHPGMHRLRWLLRDRVLRLQG